MSISDDGEQKKQNISDRRKKIEDMRMQNVSYDSIITKKLAEIEHTEEEVKHIEEQILKEKERIVSLKKEVELRDREIRDVTRIRPKLSKTLIEGNLTMAKTGSGKKLRKMYFWFERSHQGIPLLLWAPTQMSAKVERAVVTSVESAKQSFKVELGFGKNYKAGSIQVYEQNTEILKSWVSKFETALTTWKASQKSKETNTGKNKLFTVKEFTFKSSPLGFAVDTRDDKSNDLIVTSIKNEDLLAKALKVGMTITTCNGKSLMNLKNGEGMAIITTAVGNISAKNPVTIRFEGNSELLPEVKSEEKKMEDLYPDANISLSVREHPMLKNPEFAKYRDDEKFQMLCRELVSDPKKLNNFLKRKDL